MAVSALSTFYWEPKQFWEPDLDHRKQFLIQKTSIALQAIGLVGINSTLFLTAPIYIIPILCTSTAYGILGTIGAIACPLLMKGSLFQNIYPTNSWLSESQTLRVVRCVHNFFSVAGVFLAHALTLSAIRLYPWPAPRFQWFSESL